ncbi:MAG TPA: response regulator transcription factor [Pyrinomonadaceae bacterium]|nr:response regulator transcription factor [Pyrinomonadaceae bacterium]
MKTSIVIADDHDLVSKSIAALLRSIPGFEVVGQCDNGRDLIEMVQRLRPNVAIVDLGMPILNGIEVARRLSQSNRETRVIILSGYSDEASVQETLNAGIAGYVVKRGATTDLIRAIKEGTRSKVYLSAEVAAIAQRCRLRAGNRGKRFVTQRPLSPREREVLQLIVEGNTNKQVAAILGITEATAKDHRRHIKEKLGLHDLPSLTRYAIGVGMIRADIKRPA